MLIDATSFGSDESNSGPLRTLVDAFEKKFDVQVVSDNRRFPFARPDLSPQFTLANKLIAGGIIKNVWPSITFPDEPPVKMWGAHVSGQGLNAVGGASIASDADALWATLAEGLERHLWWEASDYFVSPLSATVEEIQAHGECIEPSRFVGFTDEEREKDPAKNLHAGRFLWIRGRSLVTDKQIYVPGQLVSGSGTKEFDTEPLIRDRTTIGLATWPTLEGARLAGLLEVVEREALMILWFNQLSMPRLQIAPLAAQHQTIARIVEMCERYRLRLSIIRLPTDAPAHVIGAVLEDLSGFAPRFTLGLKAHRNLALAIEKAITEALRARLIYHRETRIAKPNGPNDGMQSHLMRLAHWANPANAKKLEFLTQGPEETITEQPWDRESTEEHLERLVTWCRENHLECISTSLGTSAKNVTPWHVEMVLLPDLQPTYIRENFRLLGGTRWRTVPEKIGLKPLAKLYTDDPHPFV